MESSADVDAYDVILERREVFDGMGYDSYWHADVTRRSDGKKIVVERDWKWAIKRALKPQALARAFAFAEADERERTQRFTIPAPAARNQPERSTGEHGKQR